MKPFIHSKNLTPKRKEVNKIYKLQDTELVPSGPFKIKVLSSCLDTLLGIRQVSTIVRFMRVHELSLFFLYSEIFPIMD